MGTYSRMYKFAATLVRLIIFLSNLTPCNTLFKMRIAVEFCYFCVIYMYDNNLKLKGFKI